jgi:hypothetical protein
MHIASKQGEASNHEAFQNAGRERGSPLRGGCARIAKRERVCVMDLARDAAIDRWVTLPMPFMDPSFLICQVRGPGNEFIPLLGHVLSQFMLHFMLHFITFSTIFHSSLSSCAFLTTLLGAAPALCHPCYRHCPQYKPRCLIESAGNCHVAASQRHLLRHWIQTMAKDFQEQ